MGSYQPSKGGGSAKPGGVGLLSIVRNLDSTKISVPELQPSGIFFIPAHTDEEKG